MKYTYSEGRENETDIFLEKLFNIIRDRDIGFYNREDKYGFHDYTWFGENIDDYYTLSDRSIELVQTLRIWNGTDLNIVKSNFSRTSEELGFSVDIALSLSFDSQEISWYKLQATFKSKEIT